MAPKVTAVERFVNKVSPEPMSGCWLWTGCINPVSGYGHFRVASTGHPTPAHRAALTLLAGVQLPVGRTSRFHVDHLCRNRACVNPDHLEIVTARENTSRARRVLGNWNVRRHRTGGVCKYGHLWVTENIYASPDGSRHCRICQADRSRAHLQRKAARNIGGVSCQ